MAEIVLKDAYVGWGTSGAIQYVSTSIRQVNINYSAELLDKTAMGSSGRARIAGLKDWTITCEFHQDFASTSIDKEIFNMIGSTGNFITVRAESSNRSASNPSYQGVGLIDSYSPLNQSVGDLVTASITFSGMDGKALVRETSST